MGYDCFFSLINTEKNTIQRAWGTPMTGNRWFRGIGLLHARSPRPGSGPQRQDGRGMSFLGTAIAGWSLLGKIPLKYLKIRMIWGGAPIWGTLVLVCSSLFCWGCQVVKMTFRWYETSQRQRLFLGYKHDDTPCDMVTWHDDLLEDRENSPIFFGDWWIEHRLLAKVVEMHKKVNHTKKENDFKEKKYRWTYSEKSFVVGGVQEITRMPDTKYRWNLDMIRTWLLLSDYCILIYSDLNPWIVNSSRNPLIVKIFTHQTVQGLALGSEPRAPERRPNRSRIGSGSPKLLFLVMAISTCNLWHVWIWLVVWLPSFIFPYIGLLIIPIDGPYVSEGFKPPTSESFVYFVSILVFWGVEGSGMKWAWLWGPLALQRLREPAVSAYGPGRNPRMEKG